MHTRPQPSARHVRGARGSRGVRGHVRGARLVRGLGFGRAGAVRAGASILITGAAMFALAKLIM
eukprot:914119-Prymnesium_polylepis.1